MFVALGELVDDGESGVVVRGEMHSYTIVSRSSAEFHARMNHFDASHPLVMAAGRAEIPVM